MLHHLSAAVLVALARAAVDRATPCRTHGPPLAAVLDANLAPVVLTFARRVPGDLAASRLVANAAIFLRGRGRRLPVVRDGWSSTFHLGFGGHRDKILSGADGTFFEAKPQKSTLLCCQCGSFNDREGRLAETKGFIRIFSWRWEKVSRCVSAL